MKEKVIPSWQAIGVGILTGVVLEPVLYSLLFGMENIEYMIGFGFCTIPELLFGIVGAMIGKYRNERWVSVWIGAILGTVIGFVIVYYFLTKIPLYL